MREPARLAAAASPGLMQNRSRSSKHSTHATQLCQAAAMHGARISLLFSRFSFHYLLEILTATQGRTSSNKVQPFEPSSDDQPFNGPVRNVVQLFIYRGVATHASAI